MKPSGLHLYFTIVSSQLHCCSLDNLLWEKQKPNQNQTTTKRGIFYVSTDLTSLSTAVALLYLKKPSCTKECYTDLYELSEAQE